MAPLQLLLSGPQYLLLQLLSQVESPNSLYGAIHPGPPRYHRRGTGSGEESGLESGPQLTPLHLGIQASPAQMARGFRVKPGGDRAFGVGLGWQGPLVTRSGRASRDPPRAEREGPGTFALSCPLCASHGGLSACGGLPMPGDLSVPPATELQLGPLVLATPPPALPSQPRPENG